MNIAANQISKGLSDRRTARRALLPRNAAATKQRILVAAMHCFSAHGYSATGLRDIAESAEVSLPLLSRYFGSKAGLFEAALRESFGPPFLHGPRSQFGINLVMMTCNGGTGVNPTSICSLSTDDPEARAITLSVIEDRVIQPLVAWLGEPNARRRAEAIIMLGSGLNTHVHLLPTTRLDQPVSISDPLLSWFAAALQRIVDGDDCWDEKTTPA